MDSQKIFFNSNIKFLRERRKMSQQTLAGKISLTRTKLNALENGHTKAPQPEDYLNFSDFFKISIDSLLRIDLSKLSELKLRDLEAGNDVYLTGGKIRVLAITVNSENKENVEYIPVKAKAGYRAGYSDPEYLAQFPKFTMPNLPKGHTHRIFPTTGDSMLPIPEGSDIIGQYVQDWKILKAETPCIVILKGEQDFVFKQVTLNSDSSVLLKSYNKLFDPYTVGADDILEIWKFYSFSSKELPELQTDIQVLSKAILDIHKEIKRDR